MLNKQNNANLIEGKRRIQSLKRKITVAQNELCEARLSVLCYEMQQEILNKKENKSAA